MSDRLAEIKARLDAATPGPWKAERCHGDYRDDVGVAQAGFWIPLLESLGDGECAAMLESDASFAANARQDIPYLLDALAAMTERAERAEAGKAALLAAGEAMLKLLTDYSHGVLLSDSAIDSVFGDWLAALATETPS